MRKAARVTTVLEWPLLAVGGLHPLVRDRGGADSDCFGEGSVGGDWFGWRWLQVGGASGPLMAGPHQLAGQRRNERLRPTRRACITTASAPPSVKGLRTQGPPISSLRGDPKDGLRLKSQWALEGLCPRDVSISALTSRLVFVSS